MVRDVAIMHMSGTKDGRMAEQSSMRPLLTGLLRPPLLRPPLLRPLPAGSMRPLLTRRRAVDYCRVATAQCPAEPYPALPHVGVPA
jgi:hypothetical protein